MFNFLRVVFTVCLGMGLSGGISPARAVPDYLGSVYITSPSTTNVRFTEIDGGIERLGFRPSSDLMCDSIIATFADGTTHAAYHGYLVGGRDVQIALPEGESDVRQIDFACRTSRPISVELRISAEIGAHRDEWRQSDKWPTKWMYRFDWADETATPDS